MSSGKRRGRKRRKYGRDIKRIITCKIYLVNNLIGITVKIKKNQIPYNIKATETRVETVLKPSNFILFSTPSSAITKGNSNAEEQETGGGRLAGRRGAQTTSRLECRPASIISVSASVVCCSGFLKVWRYMLRCRHYFQPVIACCNRKFMAKVND